MEDIGESKMVRVNRISIFFIRILLYLSLDLRIRPFFFFKFYFSAQAARFDKYLSSIRSLKINSRQYPNNSRQRLISRDIDAMVQIKSSFNIIYTIYIFEKNLKIIIDIGIITYLYKY